MPLVIFAVCAYPEERGYGRLDHSSASPDAIERSAQAFGYERVVGLAATEKDANALIGELNRLVALAPTGSPPARPDLDEIERTRAT